MAKKSGGGKNKKKSKSYSTVSRELIIKQEEQEYGQIIRMLGACLVEVECFDGKKRQGRIKGTMRRRCWISISDIVLVSMRDFQDDKCDVLHKYSADESRQLKSMGELPETVKINESSNLDDDDDEVEETFIFENI